MKLSEKYVRFIPGETRPKTLDEILDDAQQRVRMDVMTYTSPTGGQKESKPARYELIPAEPLRQLAELMGKGAQKYSDHNWRLGYAWSLSFAALNRHLWAFWNGEDNDPENGSPHLAAVAHHAFALLEFMTTHPDFDDRPNTKTD